MTVPMHKAQSLKQWFSKFGMEEFEYNPDLKDIKQLWDESDSKPGLI